MTSTPPPEPDQGQETEPPDLNLLLTVVRQLLIDVEPALDVDEERAAELRLRVIAVRRVVQRFRQGMED